METNKNFYKFLCLFGAVVLTLLISACNLSYDEQSRAEPAAQTVLLNVSVPESAGEEAVDDPLDVIYAYIIQIRQATEKAAYYNKLHVVTDFPLEIIDLLEGPTVFKIVAIDENYYPLAEESYFEQLLKGENNINVDIIRSESGFKIFINQVIEEFPVDTVPVMPDFFSVIGLPINIFEAKTAADVIKSASLFTVPANKIIRRTPETVGWAPYTQTSIEVDESIKNIHRKNSTSVNAGINLGAFSGGVQSSWGSGSSVNEKGMFLEFRSRSILAEEYIEGGVSPEFWVPYLNQNAINDVINQSAGWFLDNYGSHIIHQAEYGVFARMCYTHLESQTATTTNMKAGFEAQYKVFAGGASQSNSTEAAEFRNKTTLNFVTYGGVADFMSDGDFYAGYKDWFASAMNSPGYIGSDNTGYLAIWTILLKYADIRADNAIRQKAEAIRYEFFKRALNRMTEWNWITITDTPLTNYGQERNHYIDAGGDITPKQIVVYLFGAGGGGQGAGYKYDYVLGVKGKRTDRGGGGGSGGAARFGFIFAPEKTTDYILLKYIVGEGGAGGSKKERSSEGGGYSGENGGNSQAAFNLQGTDINISVNGGEGGGIQGDGTGGNGGTSLDNPNPLLLNFFLPKDGNNGIGRNDGKGGGGGEGLSLDGYNGTAGAGGKGGSSTNGGNTGANGLIVIREITLD